MVWTPEMERRLRVLWAEGMPASRIAAELVREFGAGVTKYAVVGKSRRLGCERRENPVRAALPAGRPRKRSEMLAVAGWAAGPITRGWAPTARVGAASGCQWIGDGGGMCGAAVANGAGAWCPEHRARVYVKPERGAPAEERRKG